MKKNNKKIKSLIKDEEYYYRDNEMARVVIYPDIKKSNNSKSQPK